MADQSRQTKLAAAKKKLKEFQQKSTPVSGGGGERGAGAKKKRKVKGESQLDSPSEGRNSPDNFDRILKALSETNGVALPLCGNRQAFAPSMEPRGGSPAFQLPEVPQEEPVCAWPVSNTLNTAAAASAEASSRAAGLQSCPDTNGEESTAEDGRPLSSTESLRQLSQQLNGLVSESSSAYVNGDSDPSPLSERDLESRNQKLAAALDSSTLTNSQLSTRLDQLTQQSQELTDQLQKERKEFEQRFAKEQGAMREQLQVHIQTIGILVSEKSELQTALQYTQQAARQKSGDAEEFSSRLQSTKQRVSELERTLSSVSAQQKQADKHNKEVEKERDSLRLDLYRLSTASEEAKQQSSELREKLKLSAQENGAMRLELEELRRRLEMADIMLQQFSSQSGPPSHDQQLNLLLEEKQHLDAHNQQLLESVAQLQEERDHYAQHIQEEGSVWKDKTEQLLAQVTLVAEERDRNISQVQELEATIAELKNAAASLAQEREAQCPAEPQPSGPSESELALQEALSSVRQEMEALTMQYQAQLRDNEQLSRLCAEQEACVGALERQVESRGEEAEDRRRMLEDVQADKAALSRALTQNRTLKDQLAEFQNGFVKLTNENMELTSAIQSEQHVKKELARKLGQVQEELHDVKEQLQERTQAAQETLATAQAHLQQYYAGYQTLAAERQTLHQQLLQQGQLLQQLQQDDGMGRSRVDDSLGQLQQAQDRVEQLARDNQQLRAEVEELLDSSSMATRAQGDGVETSQHLPSSIPIPEDFESQKDMEDFIRGTLAQLEAERDEARRQLEQERRRQRHQELHGHSHAQEHGSGHAHQHTPRDHDHAHSPGGAVVPAEAHEALRVAMGQLQHRFTSLMQEKADLRERVEELEHRCIQLSGETDTIGEYIALYQSQRAIMKQKHQEKEQYISLLAQDKEEMKAKLAELQDLVMRLVTERDDWYGRYAGLVAGGNPNLLPLEEGCEVAARPHAHTDLSTDITAAEEMEVIPLSDPGQDAQPAGPREGGTAQQIMQLLQEIQNPQGAPRLPPFLGDNPCVPFFYRPDEQDEVKILVV